MKNRPGGNSAAAYLIDRLDRTGQADLAVAVRSGELTAHSAAVAAGIRKRIVQLPLADPERIAEALRRHLPDDKLRELVTRVVGLLEARGHSAATSRANPAAMTDKAKEARDRAEALFRKAGLLEKDGAKAGRTAEERTARLKAARLAKEVANKKT